MNIGAVWLSASFSARPACKRSGIVGHHFRDHPEDATRHRQGVRSVADELNGIAYKPMPIGPDFLRKAGMLIVEWACLHLGDRMNISFLSFRAQTTRLFRDAERAVQQRWFDYVKAC